MSERFVELHNIDPSDREIREWAYDEGVVFLSEDEDLILAEDRHVPVLAELVDTADCPKADWIGEILRLWARETALVVVGRDRLGDPDANRGALRWLAQTLRGETEPAASTKTYVDRLIRWTSEQRLALGDVEVLLSDLSRDRYEGLNVSRWEVTRNNTNVHARLPYGSELIHASQRFEIDLAAGSVVWWLDFARR